MLLPEVKLQVQQVLEEQVLQVDQVQGMVQLIEAVVAVAVAIAQTQEHKMVALVVLV